MKNQMLEAYITCMLWSSTDDNEMPLDQEYTENDLAPETLERCKKDCEEFLKRAGKLIEGLDYGDLGHDFWLTRNRHGAGFWDGDYKKTLGDKLTELSHEFGETNAYVNKGLIYLD